MRIAIDISEETYNEVCWRGLSLCPRGREELVKAIKNGTPLPKGHGRLIDISKLDNDRIDSDNPIIYLTINGGYTEAVSLDYLDSLQTIIEADTAESEDNE